MQLLREEITRLLGRLESLEPAPMREELTSLAELVHRLAGDAEEQAESLRQKLQAEVESLRADLQAAEPEDQGEGEPATVETLPIPEIPAAIVQAEPAKRRGFWASIL